MRNSILSEVGAERERQIDKWGSETDLKTNTPMDFVGYIAHHSTRWFNGGFRPYPRETMEDFRKEMVKTAALAVAAIEFADALLNEEASRPDIME